jgi:hypothetical protein
MTESLESSNHITLLERISHVNPEMGGYFALRRFTWPTAVLQRIAIFVEYGARMEDPIKYAIQQFTTHKPSRDKMLDFVMEQHQTTKRNFSSDSRFELILPKSQIHVVNLREPFKWDGSQSRARLLMVSDLAKCARGEFPDEVTNYHKLIEVQNDYACQNDKKMKEILARIKI